MSGPPNDDARGQGGRRKSETSGNSNVILAHRAYILAGLEFLEREPTRNPAIEILRRAAAARTRTDSDRILLDAVCSGEIGIRELVAVPDRVLRAAVNRAREACES